ncbi:DUF1801 domain-containing protein [Arthrobacter sp. zg-ZUI100]|uniref:DUF1801 domain-containing protein n=1 Tax=Arthrobacter jiangjiafuii TaxID=2817475 RepID=UPI001AEEC997|nr:DUF1801 domain-containing protein [Arthrobacter jiangjiafuii]MBP3036698.1 DUF1801 domain-containing protein [Arthrobacter jiangjiafuii]
MEPTAASVSDFIDGVTSPTRKRDAHTLVDLMSRITGKEPAMWGPTIVGFGSYHYKYASGREGDAAAAGFSPRKAATTVYLPDGVGAYTAQLARLGTHTTGAGCLYLKDLSKIDLGVLEDIITESYQRVTAGTFGQRAADSDS